MKAILVGAILTLLMGCGDQSENLATGATPTGISESASSTSTSTLGPTSTAAPAPTPTATSLPPEPTPASPATPVIRSCAEIRASGTYLNDEERAFFLENCQAPTPMPSSPVRPTATPSASSPGATGTQGVATDTPAEKPTGTLTVQVSCFSNPETVTIANLTTAVATVLTIRSSFEPIQGLEPFTVNTPLTVGASIAYQSNGAALEGAATTLTKQEVFQDAASFEAVTVSLSVGAGFYAVVVPCRAGAGSLTVG